MFEKTFNNIDKILRNEDDCSTELDYIEQTSWLLFLKYLDDVENDKKIASELSGIKYVKTLEDRFTWSSWASPKKENGEIDLHSAQTGDDLVNFVEEELFPYLKNLNKDSNVSEYKNKLSVIFSELKNKIGSGYNLRAMIDLIDTLRFRSQEERHEMSVLYESRINRMGNAGRNGGEYYTPRPLIKTIIKIIDPKVGQTIYDGACGSAGFLCEAYNFFRKKKNLSAKELEFINKSSLFGKEKKPLAFIVGLINMILHGVESPNIVRKNTLKENIRNINDEDRFDVILANPPFGSDEVAEVEQNFPIKSSEPAYLFLQHFIKILKTDGSAGIVIKNTFLSNSDAKNIRKELFETCNVHTILDLPEKVFQAGQKTIVLFFKKGIPTKKIWFYELKLNRNLGKTNPLNDKDLHDFEETSKTKLESENSWNISIDDIDKKTWDLSVNNPNRVENEDSRSPEEILTEIDSIDKEINDALKAIRNVL